MYKAFLSHSSLDKPVVRKIKENIQRIWTYFDEDCFEPGEDFRSAIVERLSNTKKETTLKRLSMRLMLVTEKEFFPRCIFCV